MTAAPTFFNNYQATAASGIGGFDDYVEVDVLPHELDPDLDSSYAQGSIEVPITLSYGDPATRLNMICLGYTDTPSKRLYVGSLYSGGTSEPCTIVCALNRAAMAAFQTTRMHVTGTYSGWDAATVDVTVNTWVTIDVASTITLDNGTNLGLGLADYQTFDVGLATAHLLFHDYLAGQPAITWVDSTDAGIIWEAGSAPQFQSGKTHMLVTIIGGQFGFVRHFA